MRKNILDYHPDNQDAVRREYILRGPCQPRAHVFPRTKFGDKLRRFNPHWFDKYNWLEYSVEKDAAFCFMCYLFKNNDGFKGCNRLNGFDKHVGKVNSIHNQARTKFEDLTKPKTLIRNVFLHQSSKVKKEYRDRLLASLSCIRYLLHQGLAIRGHDESSLSINKGNFLELLEWLAKHTEDIDKVVLKNAPKNNQLTAHFIQRDLINDCAKETTKVIVKELDEDYFVILVDESADISHKEQMSLCIHYVDKRGDVVELCFTKKR